MSVWYVDPANVAALYRHLADEGSIATDDIADLIEKPWKWTPEWRELQTVLATEAATAGTAAA